jgi:hypothetical protein
VSALGRKPEMFDSPNRTSPSFDGAARPLLAGLLAIQAFLGYEWLMSSLSKALNSGFVSGLGDNLTATSTDMSAGFYKSFLDGTVIPNVQAFGYLVQFGELAIGITLITVSGLWWFRWAALSVRSQYAVLGLIVLAGAFAIFMNVNFHLAGGASHPWLIAADPFGEGVDLDSVMPLIQVAISLVSAKFLLDLRAAVHRSTISSTIVATA